MNVQIALDLGQSPGLSAGRFHWTGGFWGDRFDALSARSIPGMFEALNDKENAAYLGNFHEAATPGGTHHGVFWSDGDCYKFVQAVAHVYERTQDPALDRMMDEIITDMASAQQEDGYINTQITIPGKGRWVNQRHHELYNIGHLFTAGAVHHLVTGKRSLLDVAIRAADCVDGVFRSRPAEFAHYEFNPSNIMGLVELYRVTGEERYLTLAQIFVDMRGRSEGGLGDQNQDRVPVRDEHVACGHAVTATYLWAGAADTLAHQSDPDLMAALERIWQDVVERKVYVTGGVGPYHIGLSERAAPHLQEEADIVWEAFALPYMLPNASAYNETCANIGLAMWGHRMMRLTGDARYTDMMETVLYNSALSATDLGQTKYCYTNPLRWHGADHRKLSHDSNERWDRWSCYCCPPQVVRTVASVHDLATTEAGRDVWLHLLGAGRFEGQGTSGLTFHVATEYPWGATVEIEIEAAPAEEVAVHLRIPGWCREAALAVNGGAQAAQPGTYATLRRVWSAGDHVTLDLGMEPELLIGHPKVEETRGQVALRRGPVVYCLEDIDLPEGVPIEDVTVRADAPVEVVPAGENSLGVPSLRTSGQVLDGVAGSGLYRPMRQVSTRPVDLTFIPYFAWNNRGPCKMSVWVPMASA